MRSAVLICALGFIFWLVNSSDWLTAQLSLRSDESFLKSSLSILIERELVDKQIPGLAIAVIDDQNTLFEAGFGLAELQSGTPVSPYTVFQAGAVAQLFTTIAILQRVEYDKLDLDVPISTYIPSFNPQNPFGLDVTLRQVLSHQSGLVTEPPVGHYFDDTAPDLEAIVRSLNETTIVFPPETFTKYSNAGYAVAGRVLESALEKPFEQHMRAVLDRMHLKRTSFTPRLDLRNKLATGHLIHLDDRVKPLDEFAVPNGPANNLYTTINDLGAFLRVMFADGMSPNGIILNADSFEEMWTIQLSTARKQLPFGLGFAITVLENERRATLTSNTHGFTTRIDLLPDHDIGVVVFANLEHADASLEKIAGYALQLARANQHELPTPPLPKTEPPDSAMVSRATGYYVNNVPLRISPLDNQLYLYQNFRRHRLRQKGDSLIIDDRKTYGPLLISDGLTLEYKNTLYPKRNTAVPRAGAPQFAEYVGNYGLPVRPLSVVERNNMLFALDGWNYAYTLQPAGKDTFQLPVDAMYGGEQLVFMRNEAGIIDTAVFANMPLEKLNLNDLAATFTTLPLEAPMQMPPSASVAPPDTLASTASQATELVDLTMVDPLFNLDIRYATGNNLLSTQLYEESRALLQKPVAESIFRIQRAIRRLGYELVIYDTYQPWFISNEVWHTVPDSLRYFFNDPEAQFCQNNGTAVSLGLVELSTGAPLPMPTDFDVLAPQAYADSPLPDEQLRWNRDFLRRLMEAEGFTVSANKWWHFTHKSCPHYDILNDTYTDVEYVSTDNLQRIFTVDR